MIRVEVIPYKGLDQRYELTRQLEKDKRNKKFKNYSDLGNCFYIIHHDNKGVN